MKFNHSIRKCVFKHHGGTMHQLQQILQDCNEHAQVRQWVTPAPGLASTTNANRTAAMTTHAIARLAILVLKLRVHLPW